MRCTATATLGLALLSGFRALADEGTPLDFDWGSITPSPDLQYHPCHGSFYCARLEVPLDWLSPVNNNTVAIAIIKTPATVNDTDPSFGGPILINPGGPGGSGVALGLAVGERFRDIFDGNKHYEIIGFDPRGVEHTTPKADCYRDPIARAASTLQVRGAGELVADPRLLGRRHALTGGFGRLCGEERGGEPIMSYVSTASVARDMVQIIDKIEELREREKAAYSGPDVSPGQHPVALGSFRRKQAAPGTTPNRPARLQYFGFSYGTFLGNTFASMFPGRVGRIVGDGVVDADDYVAGDWLKNLQDTDALIDYFYKTCFDAPSDCALFRVTDSRWQDIKDRVEATMAELAANPIPLIIEKEVNFVSEQDLKVLIFNSLYNPIDLFYSTATTVDYIIRKDLVNLAGLFGVDLPPTLEAVCSNGTMVTGLISHDAEDAILCGDGDDSTGLTLQDWAGYISELHNQSAVGGAFWAETRFACSGWQHRPKYRYTGPFTTPEADPAISEGRPAAPLLFLSSRLDPVTPLRNAHAMAARHPGAAVLMQDSVGHAAVNSSPSECTANVLRAYFENGTVPNPGAVCPGDCEPFKPCGGAAAAAVERRFALPLGPRRAHGLWDKLDRMRRRS